MFVYHLISTVDPAFQTALGEGEVIETELAKTNSNAAVRVKKIAEVLNIIMKGMGCCLLIYVKGM